MDIITNDTLYNQNTSLHEKCKEFGAILGLDKPVSEKVLIAAMNRETYAYNLLVSRSSMPMLEYLIQNPPKIDKPEYLEEQSVLKKTNKELLTKATKSLLNWSKTGFSTVDKSVLKIREDACLSCPNLSAPSSGLQKIIPGKIALDTIGKRTGKQVCNLCGCNVGKKMRMTSESCPSKHPDKIGFTRWNEPVIS